jgi:hypothetical protein
MEDGLFLPHSLSPPCDSYDTFVAVFSIVCFSVVLFVAFRYGNVMERLVGDGSSSIMTPLATLPAQMIGQVYNPFAVSLAHEHRASLKDGVTLNITAKNPCWIGIYWGSLVADVYPIIYHPWKEFCARDVTAKSLSDISLHYEQLQFHEAVDDETIDLKPPAAFALGAPPRDRYPLLLLIMDSIACEMTPEETIRCQRIVSMVLLVHLKDALCPADSHIFSSFVRTPHCKPHDMKQLYVSRTDEPPSTAATVDSSSADNDGNNDTDTDTRDTAASASMQCTVCQAAPIERALLPCRHTCVCTGCCAVLLNCPMCRAFITSSFEFTPHDSANRT